MNRRQFAALTIAAPAIAACQKVSPVKPEATTEYQGVTSIHNLRALKSGRFAALHDKWHKLDPNYGPNVTRLRCYMLSMFATEVKRIHGDFVTVGVSYGVAPRVIYDFVDFGSLGKKYHLVDPFTGVDGNIGEPVAKYNNDVKRVVSQYPTGAPIAVHKAFVPDDLPLAGVSAIAFAHLNTGAWNHEARSLKYFYDLLSPGAVMVIDGYGASPGHQDVYDPFLDSLGAEIFTLPTGQGVIFKS